MTQEPSPQAPAGLNGNSPTSPARQTADGVSAIAGMLPQMAQAFGTLLGQLPMAIGQAVRVPRQLCAPCVLARLGWEHKHEAEMAAASEGYQQAAEEATRLGVPMQQAPEAFLPEPLRPGQPDGMPQPQPGITMVGGTLVCAEHVPGAPGKPGAKKLLVVHGALSTGMLAGLGG
jgi:hypothetical protein